jgi:flagella basal body P-ring formation protein FlgA
MNRISGALANTAMLCLVAISIIVLPSAVVSGEICRITVSHQVDVEGEMISLGKIAQIDCNDQQQTTHLKDIVLGKAPMPARRRTLTSDFIQVRLRQNHVNLTDITLRCPQQVHIGRATIEVQKAEIEKILKDFLVQHALQDNKAARIKKLHTPDSLILPKGRITYKVVAPRNTNFIGKIPLSIDFQVGQQYRKRVWTTAIIEMLVDVVVTTKPLGRHKPITPDDIEIQTRDMADLPANAISDPDAVMGKRTRRAIHTRTVLRSDMVELPPLVNRGDIVLIIAESNGLRITALGKVKKRGRLGELIPVENYDSKKILYAQVIDSRTVKVEF